MFAFRRLIRTLLLCIAFVFVATFVAVLIDPGARSQTHAAGVDDSVDVGAIALLETVSLLVAQDPGDLQYARLHPITRVLISLVFIAGTLLMAMIIGFVTDRLLKLRVDLLLGRKGTPRMKDHIILVGLGTVGWRVFEQLQRFERDLLCIEKDESVKFVDRVRKTGTTVIVGDPRDDDTLKTANVMEARSIICATSDDLANLEVALDAREMNPEIRVVLRCYDQALARKFQGAFNIHVAFSSAALAAPAFACAALDRAIVNSQYLDSLQVVTLRVEVEADSALTKVDTRELTEQFPCVVLKHKPVDGEPRLHPRDRAAIKTGDVLLLSTTFDQVQPIKDAAGYSYS